MPHCNIRQKLVQGTVYRFFRCTTNCKCFDKALNANQECLKKQKLEIRLQIVHKTMETLVVGKQKASNLKKNDKQLSKNIWEQNPNIILHYRCNLSVIPKEKPQKLSWFKFNFLNSKMKTCLRSLKSSFDKNLKSHLVYEISCSSCESTYVGETCRHVITRVTENQRDDSPVGQHNSDCCGSSGLLIGESLNSAAKLENWSHWKHCT